GLAVNLEIKPATGYEEVTGATVAALAVSQPPRAGLLLSSFSEPALLAAKALAPEVERAVLVEQIPSDWPELLARHEAVALHASARLLDNVTAQAIISAGIPLACYTVNDLAQARSLLALGVSSVFSDRPDLLLNM
ncbi:MAG TPA: glycerophosphodiester phosphodiesterase family protein, partial [Rhodocyclaceae bacterium]|nr:glycerophosphodiester phosphodiesterase family protein [Rhodocyclaceae bacterium]